MKKQAPKPATSGARKIPRRRRILYSLIPLLLLLTILEVGARIVDARLRFRARLLDRLALQVTENEPIGADSGLNWPPRTVLVRSPNEPRAPGVRYSIGGRVILEDMRPPVGDFLEPAGIVRQGERRLFIVGGSAAFGYPYAYRDTFAGQLGSRLQPRGIRVLNAAQVGSSSGRLVPVVRRIVEQFEPDALVIFAGNNEWFQWLPRARGTPGAGSARLLRFLAGSRALAAVETWVLGSAPLAHDPAEDQESRFHAAAQIAGSSYALKHPLDDPDFDERQWLRDKRRFLDVFEDNLTAMVALARERNVRVVLLTVPFNYRLSPAWKHPQPRWYDPAEKDALVAAHREAGELLAEGRFPEALVRIKAALALDRRPPVLNHMRGECLERLGEPWAAEEAYAQCRENMVGNLGSCLSINESIARVAEAHGVTLIDVKRLFDRYGREHGRPFNEDLIHDDCHPTPEGHRIIADALERVFTE